MGERRGTGKEDGEKGGGSMWAELEEWGRWEDNRVGKWVLLVSSGLARGLADGRTLKRDKIDVEREENLMEMKEGNERLVFFFSAKKTK